MTALTAATEAKTRRQPGTPLTVMPAVQQQCWHQHAFGAQYEMHAPARRLLTSCLPQ